ncbi:hypothetical protein [Amycolatopsis palatopharyngis]|uniref:hypothetical protein n=1 Tax=Amycolatopsis palatopharyngis TaxID=187982 RepID=UPI000E249AA1|nr:hypothetical protein [Amycolatopsis palatopharyngis]
MEAHIDPEVEKRQKLINYLENILDEVRDESRPIENFVLTVDRPSEEVSNPEGMWVERRPTGGSSYNLDLTIGRPRSI